MTPRNDFVDESYILGLGFTPLEKDDEWPHTMIYQKDNYTIQYVHPWGQGEMDEGWMLKKDGVEVPFYGYRNTRSGKMGNAYILFEDQLKKLLL